MKVTIISLGLLKVFILNELNENVIECQKEKTSGSDIIYDLPSDNTQKAQKLSLDAPCDPPHVFERERHIAPRRDLPDGEPDALICWELVYGGDSNTPLLQFSVASPNPPLPVSPMANMPI
jgi:hypothetical protein